MEKLTPLFMEDVLLGGLAPHWLLETNLALLQFPFEDGDGLGDGLGDGDGLGGGEGLPHPSKNKIINGIFYLLY